MTALLLTKPPIIHSGPLRLEKLGATGRKFKLLAPGLDYESAIPGVGRFQVPEGRVTNLHSIPIGARNIFDPTDYAESGVAHDHLYEEGELPTLLGYRKITRKQADQVHREILRLMGAPGWKIALMYAGLRIGGWKAWNAYRRNDANRRLQRRRGEMAAV